MVTKSVQSISIKIKKIISIALKISNLFILFRCKIVTSKKSGKMRGIKFIYSQ